MKDLDKSVTSWVKFGGQGHKIDLCFVGKETIAIGQSSYIIFISLKSATSDTTKSLIYEADGFDNHPDGINCLAGHGTAPIFAVAENKLKAQVYLLAYPTFAQVANLKCKAPVGYQALAFSEGEIIVSLTRHPDFALTIWNWMSGDELKTINTKITTFVQKLKCFSNSPILISQISEETNELTIWEVSICYNTCHVVSKPIDMPDANYYSTCWTPESLLWFINDKGDVYSIDPETSKPILFLHQDNGFILEKLRPCIGYYKSNLIVTTSDGTLKVFKKQKGNWTENKQTFGLKNPVFKMITSQDWNILVGWTNMGEILKMSFSDINDGDTTFTALSLTNFGEAIFDIGVVNPEQKCFVSINSKQLLQLWKIDTGELVSIFQTHGNYTSMTEHPSLPIIVLGTGGGAVHFINLSNITSPNTLCFFVLDNFEITKVIFDNSGVFAVAAGLHIGTFFLLQAFPNSDQLYQVTHYLKLEKEVLSFNVTGSLHDLCLALLFPAPQVECSNKINNKKENVADDKKETKTSSDLTDVNIEIDQDILMPPRQELVLYRITREKENEASDDLEEAGSFRLHATLKLPFVCTEDELKEDDTIPQSNYYSELAAGGGIFLKSTQMYALPVHSRKIHVLETDIKELLNAGEAQLVKVINTGHQIKCSGKLKKAVQIGTMHEKDCILLTFGADGLIFLREQSSMENYEEKVIVLRNHHYIKGGIRKAVCISSGNFVISLGWDGCIVGKNIVHENQKDCSNIVAKQPQSSEEVAEIILFLKNLQSNQMADSKLTKTWIQLQAEKIIRKEEQVSDQEKQSILEEFQAVKSELNALITKNEQAPKLAQLALSEFDLNKKMKEEKFKEAEVKRQKEELEILDMIKNNINKAEALRKECWEPMDVKGKCIKALQGELEVENYPLLPDKPDFEEKVGQVIERRAMEIELTVSKLFTPWIPRSDSYTQRLLHQGQMSATQSKYSVQADEKTRLYMAMMATDDEAEETDKSIEERITPTVSETDIADFNWSGSISHKFVTIPECLHRQQLELYTFNSSYNETIILEYIINKLRRYFNNEFEKTMEFKRLVMSRAAESVARLHQIKSEHQWCLKAISSVSLDKNSSRVPSLIRKESASLKLPSVNTTSIFEPKWNPREIPETGIMAVDDSEVNAVPYLTPEEEEIIAEKAKEEEQLRKLRAADNFRELALIEMMDGVLEVRWEDEIKKDIPKPIFIDVKNPEDWTENEIKLAKEYETKVKFLNSERDRYRKILEHEFEICYDDHMRELSRFDKKLLELHKLKLQVEASIAQENMKMMSMQVRNDKIISLKNEEQQILKHLSEVKKEVEDAEMEIQELQGAAQECTSVYESIAHKDRQLDQSFRKENEYSTAVSEQRYKIFKRRPKTHLRSTLSMALIAEVWKIHGLKVGSWKEIRTLGQQTAQQRKLTLIPAYSHLLLPDAIDFLQTLDSMDAYTNSFPGVDEEGWTNLCKLRRSKIQNEIKLKISAQELVDANSALEQGQKYVKTLNAKVEKLEEELNRVRTSKLDICHNAQVQLILKNGMIEIDCNGSLTDFSDAILIHQSVIEKINDAIKEKGEIKLKTMKDYADFRRTVLLCEWEHKKMKMEIQDLEDQINMVESTKVTKDMLTFLASADGDEKTPRKLDREIAFLKEIYGKRSKGFQDKMEDLDKKIDAKERENRRLDNAIRSINIDVNEQLLQCDPELEQKAAEAVNERMAALVRRSQLVNEIQRQYNDILVLQTELELLRLKTYPTFKYTTLT